MGFFKLLSPGAVYPTRATEKSAGFDLVATSYEWAENGSQIIYRTGIGLDSLPEGFFGLLTPRSSIYQYDLRLANSVGVIDADYTGEILVVFDAPLVASLVLSRGNARVFSPGDKVAQLVLLPYMTDGVVVETERTGGFGSSDKRVKKGTTKDGHQDS